MASPSWYEQAAAALAAGKTQQEVSKALGIGERTLRRALKSPDGALRGMVEQLKARTAQADADGAGKLRGMALSALEKAVSEGDVAAAKAVLSAVPAAAQQAEEEQEAEATPEEALEEVVAAFPAITELARTGALPQGLVEQLRACCRNFLLDDLQPRPPIDCSAEMVQPEAADAPRGRPGDDLEAAKIVPAAAPPALGQQERRQVQEHGAGSAVVVREATVIPIRGP